MPRAFPQVLSPITERDSSSSPDLVRALPVPRPTLASLNLSASPSPPPPLLTAPASPARVGRRGSVSFDLPDSPRTPDHSGPVTFYPTLGSPESPLTRALKRRDSLPAAFVPREKAAIESDAVASPSDEDDSLPFIRKPHPLAISRRPSLVTSEDDDLPTPKPTATSFPSTATRPRRDSKPIPTLVGPNSLPYARCPSGTDAYSYSGTNLDPFFLFDEVGAVSTSRRRGIACQTEVERAYVRSTHRNEAYITSERQEEAMAIRREIERTTAEMRADMAALGLGDPSQRPTSTSGTPLSSPSRTTTGGSPIGFPPQWPSSSAPHSPVMYSYPQPSSTHSSSAGPFVPAFVPYYQSIHYPAYPQEAMGPPPAPAILPFAHFYPLEPSSISLPPIASLPAPLPLTYQSPYFPPPPQPPTPRQFASVVELDDPFSCPAPLRPEYAASHSRCTSNASTASSSRPSSRLSTRSALSSKAIKPANARSASAASLTYTSIKTKGAAETPVKDPAGGRRARSATSALDDADWRHRAPPPTPAKSTRSVRI